MEKMNKDTVLVKFDGVGTTTVYRGGMSCLKEAPLKWRMDEDMSETMGLNVEVLTVGEVMEQIVEHSFQHEIITIVFEGPLSGEIWQYGNRMDVGWECIGTLRGYA